MGIAEEEEDTEGAVAKEVENQTNEPIIFHLCFVKFFLTTDVLCQVAPPDFVPCSVTGVMTGDHGLTGAPIGIWQEVEIDRVGKMDSTDQKSIEANDDICPFRSDFLFISTNTNLASV
jgi:hypothetical protein